MGDDVVAQREYALAAEALGHALAGCPIPGDHTIGSAVDHGQIHPLLTRQSRLDLCHRCQHPEIAPVDGACHAPASLGHGKLAGDLPAVHAGADDLLQHGPQVRAVPGTHGQYRVGLSRGNTQHRLGLELEPFTAQQGMNLTQKARTQQHLRWVVHDGLVGRIEPALGIGQRRKARHGRVQQLGQRQQQLAAHARVGGRRPWEHQRHVPCHGLAPEIGIAAQAVGWLVHGQRLAEARTFLLMGCGIGCHMHQAAGACAALCALGQRLPQGGQVGGPIAENPREALLAGQHDAAGISLTQVDRGALAAQGADMHIQLAGNRTQPGQGGLAGLAQAHAPVEGGNGAGHMEQARGGVGMAQKGRDRGQAWVCRVEANGLAHHRHLLPGLQGGLRLRVVRCLGLETLQVGRQRQREALAIHDGEHGTALLPGLIEAHQRQYHRRIARDMALSWQHGPGCGLMHRLAAQVHSTHQRDIQQVLAQGAAGDLQGTDAGEFLCHHRVARALQVEQQADAVGDDVGHGAHGCAYLELACTGFPQGGQPRLADLEAMPAPCQDPFLGMGPTRIAGDLGIATHADEHAAARGLQGAQPRGHMAGGLQDQQLLGQGLGEILGRVAQTLEGQSHRLDAPWRGLAGDQRLHEGAVGLRAACGHLQGHHGKGRCGQRLAAGGRRPAPPLAWVPFLHDHMGVVAAKAKGVDAGAPWTIALPGLGLLQQVKAELIQFLDGLGHRAVGRHDLVLQGTQ